MLVEIQIVPFSLMGSNIKVRNLTLSVHIRLFNVITRNCLGDTSGILFVCVYANIQSSSTYNNQKLGKININ